MRKLSSILILSICFLQALAQEPSWRKLWTIPTDSTAIWDADETGSLYVVVGNQISKYSQDGKLAMNQSIRSIGTIQKVDAENSLKPTLFSEDQQQVCFLDNALAVQNCVDLAEQNIQLASQFSSSIQTDRFWVYDQSNSQLILITARNQQQQRVQNLKGLVEFSELHSFEEYNNQLYLIDSENRVLIFDNFGNLTNQWELPEHRVAHPLGEGLLIAKGSSLYAFSFSSQEELHFYAGESEIIAFHFSGNRLFIQEKSGISCFELLD